MKKLSLASSFSPWVISFTVVAMFSLLRCKQPEPVNEILPGDSLLSQFNQSPPLVEGVFMQKLDKADKEGNSVLLTVNFSAEETRLRGINSIPLTLSKRQIKLNDRGIEGDQKVSDGVFTIPLKATDNELQTLLNNNNNVLAKQKNIISGFNGRVAIVREISNFNQDSLKLKKRIPLEVFFFSQVNQSSLPNIREKSLMVTDVLVVEDKTRTYDPCRLTNKGNADGVWSFKTLIKNMAGGITAEQFLIDWVDNFLFSQHTLSSTDATTNRLRSKERLIKAWMNNSGFTVSSAAGIPTNWQSLALKAEEFPVRLLAIVNRLDLRTNPGYGGFKNAGEGRFVFSFVDSRANCSNGQNAQGTMTFILEYGIPISNCQALIDYGKDWWDLQSIPFGDDFNQRLEKITNVFTTLNANPSRPNGSALNHLRTNDFLPASFSFSDPWDIRDFEIDQVSKKLKIIHPNREPMESSNGFATVPVNSSKLSALVAFVNALPFSSSNLNPSYSIPDPLKGIHAPMRVFPPDRYHWVGNASLVMLPLKRREFSFNTCSGCHKGETNNPFTHVRPRAINAAAELSGFMTGLGTDDDPDMDTNPMGDFWVNDPGPSPQPPRGFNEARDRAWKLEALVFNSPCLIRPGLPGELIEIERILRFRPLNMVH